MKKAMARMMVVLFVVVGSFGMAAQASACGGYGASEKEYTLSQLEWHKAALVDAVAAEDVDMIDSHLSSIVYYTNEIARLESDAALALAN